MGFMFMFIAHEQPDVLLYQTTKRNKLGLKAVLTYATYLIAELLWLYSYGTSSSSSSSSSSSPSSSSSSLLPGKDNPIKVTAVVMLALAYAQVHSLTTHCIHTMPYTYTTH